VEISAGDDIANVKIKVKGRRSDQCFLPLIFAAALLILS
jgi:hypothetical protein